MSAIGVPSQAAWLCTAMLLSHTIPLTTSELYPSTLTGPGWNCVDSSYEPFHCGSGIDCIPHEWVCNGFLNCPDGSDELNCNGGFHCSDTGRWFPYERICNGYANCQDASDEMNCWICEFECSSGACVSLESYCDGINDCGDWSDEPSDCNCPNTDFICAQFTNFTDKCVEVARVCDGVNDCMDGSDEGLIQCSTNCLSSEFQCDTGVSHFFFSPCIIDDYVCDDYIDCADGSDESNCAGCPNRCISDISAYHGEDLVYICDYDIQPCDGIEHCLDGSDESAALCGCSDGIDCALTRRCAVTRNSVECDGVNDCGDVRDWTDECYCSYGDYQVRFCNNTGRCLAPWQICDGIDDCGNESDEQNCSSVMEYHSHVVFPCQAFSDVNDRFLTDISLVCDGAGDCVDGSDESVCDEPCGTEETRCATGTSILPGFPICVPNSMWCDGTAHCVDHSDEEFFLCLKQCDEYSGVQVRRCQSVENPLEYICLTPENNCDGFTDCAENEDENSCRKNYWIVGVVCGLAGFIIIVSIIVGICCSKKSKNRRVTHRPERSVSYNTRDENVTVNPTPPGHQGLSVHCQPTPHAQSAHSVPPAYATANTAQKTAESTSILSATTTAQPPPSAAGECSAPALPPPPAYSTLYGSTTVKLPPIQPVQPVEPVEPSAPAAP